MEFRAGKLVRAVSTNNMLNQVYYRVETPQYKKEIGILKSFSLADVNIKLLSVVNDPKTMEEVAQLPKDGRIDVDPTQITKKQFFQTLYEHRADGIIFVLGHIKDSSLILAGTNGQVDTVLVGELQEFAERNGISVAVLGCDAKYKASIGTTEGVIFSAKMVRQFRSALAKRGTVLSFFENLSNQRERLVISSVSLRRIGGVGLNPTNVVLVASGAVRHHRLVVSAKHYFQNQTKDWRSVSTFLLSVEGTNGRYPERL